MLKETEELKKIIAVEKDKEDKTGAIETLFNKSKPIDIKVENDK